MSAKEAYSYVTLRYVHDVLTGEFANVGLVMLVPRRPLILAEFRTSSERVANFFPDLDRDAFARSMAAIERGIASVQRGLQGGAPLIGEETAGDYAHAALPRDDSSFQWSPIASGLTAEPGGTFKGLYERFVLRYDRPRLAVR